VGERHFTGLDRYQCGHIETQLQPSCLEVSKRDCPTTFAILDRTELKIERPTSLLRQSQSYSDYESTNTLKGLVACDPRGLLGSYIRDITDIFMCIFFCSSISNIHKWAYVLIYYCWNADQGVNKLPTCVSILVPTRSRSCLLSCLFFRHIHPGLLVYKINSPLLKCIFMWLITTTIIVVLTTTNSGKYHYYVCSLLPCW